MKRSLSPSSFIARIRVPIRDTIHLIHTPGSIRRGTISHSTPTSRFPNRRYRWSWSSPRSVVSRWWWSNIGVSGYRGSGAWWWVCSLRGVMVSSGSLTDAVHAVGLVSCSHCVGLVSCSVDSINSVHPVRCRLMDSIDDNTFLLLSDWDFVSV